MERSSDQGRFSPIKIIDRGRKLLQATRVCDYPLTTVEVTRHRTDFSNGHIDDESATSACSVDTSCKAHGVLDPCACSNHTDRCHKIGMGVPNILEFVARGCRKMGVPII